MLGSGSGFLALDKNGNGKIDDGSELFGTKSGDGFADLAEYDSDGNGWIDEKGRVYVLYEVKEIMKDMSCGNQKVAKLIAELEKYGLIIRERQGYGRPAHIYVMNFASRMDKEEQASA